MPLPQFEIPIYATELGKAGRERVYCAYQSCQIKFWLHKIHIKYLYSRGSCMKLFANRLNFSNNVFLIKMSNSIYIISRIFFIKIDLTVLSRRSGRSLSFCSQLISSLCTVIIVIVCVVIIMIVCVVIIG